MYVMLYSVMCCAVYCIVTGTIPSEFCTSDGISINVRYTSIDCYSGCLTSSHVSIIGASDECHDGRLMLQFIIAVCCGVVLVLVFSFGYRLKTESSLALQGCSGGQSSGNAPSGIWKYHLPVVSLTFLKLLLVIIISLSLNVWWTYGDGNHSDTVVQSCSSTTVGNCDSFCGVVDIVDVSITTDDFTVESIEGEIEKLGTGHYSSEPYCVAEFKGDCAYKYWLLFNLIPMLFHIVGFALQCLTWRHYKVFTPQQKQYDIIIEYLYPEVDIDGVGVDGNSGGTIHGDTCSTGSTYRKSSNEAMYMYQAMFQSLTKRPFDSIFALIELVTVAYVWGELWYPPIYCGSVRPLSLYYYPLLMTLLDLTKFNFYISTRLFGTQRYQKALFALLNAEMLVTNAWVTTMLAVVYMITLFLECIKLIDGLLRLVYYKLCGRSGVDWAWSQPASSTTSTASPVDVTPGSGPGLASGLASGSGTCSRANTATTEASVDNPMMKKMMNIESGIELNDTITATSALK